MTHGTLPADTHVGNNVHSESREKLGIWYGDLVRALVLFWRENGLGMAGMIAFFGFLSIVPLVILLLAFFGDVLGSHITPNQVQKLLHGVMPGLSQHQFIQTYWVPVRHSHRATTVLGVVSLVFGTLGLHDSVDWAVNRLWHCTVGRSFWLNKLRGVLVIFWAAGLAVLTLASTSLWSLVLNAAHVEGIGELGWLTLLPSYALDAAIFTALYRLTPIVSVRNRPAFAGGVLGATLWEVSKVVFGWWVLQVGTYNRVYGPLAASIVVMLWLWVSSAVFLFGAGLSASIQRRWEAQEKGHHPVAPG